MAQSMILCTDLSVDIRNIRFPSKQTALLGKMLGVADLFAQMADRKYLEKLLFLYREFEEGVEGMYEGQVDLLQKTVSFYDLVDQRVATVLDRTNRFFLSHLKSRWNIHVDLYQEAIEKQRNYLHQILTKPQSDPRDHLRRWRIGAKISKTHREGDSVDSTRRNVFLASARNNFVKLH